MLCSEYIQYPISGIYYCIFLENGKGFIEVYILHTDIEIHTVWMLYAIEES